MLDFPVISRDRTFERRDAGETVFRAPARPPARPPAAAWRPRLVMAPAWRLDTRARLHKRCVDLTLALVALVLLTPFALGVMLAIRLESAGPVLFRQRRVGLHGQSFTVFKFRTMRQHDTIPGVLCQATRHDPRVTRVGCWLRRRSLDELPQLLNVLRGEMSIVGPRPHAPGTRAGGRLFEDVTHRYATRHCVKPGMTGLAQVRGWRGETDTEDKLLGRLECDLEYIATWSAKLDLLIIWRTPGSLSRTRNAY